MSEKLVADGLLFYASIYVNTILLFIAFITSRWIFLLFIVFTFALTVYLMYLSTEHLDHIKKTGEWAHENIQKIIAWAKPFLHRKNP